MKIGINIKVDVTKIDKKRLFKGEKGTYLDLTSFIDTENTSQYGDNGVVSQSLTKDERVQKVQLPILGNVRVFYKDGDPQADLKNGPNDDHQPPDDSDLQF